MLNREKGIVVDIDGTLCPVKADGQQYSDLIPSAEVVQRLREYREAGFYIILFTSRQMRTFDGNIGLIMAQTAPTTIEWLKRHSVPYDEIHFGKPWPGCEGFYVDDRAIRPSEFLKHTYEQIQEIIAHE
jgi:capsule biosynthesis phosphatase